MGMARFVLRKTEDGMYVFSLVAGNGHVIATSGQYQSKTAAINGIKSVKGNAPDARLDDQTEQTT